MLEFRKVIHLPHGWDAATRAVARDYLQRRLFRISRLDPSGLAGDRGSWLGNLTAFDMSRLRANLSITSLGDSRVEVVLTVNTLFQVITEWNRAAFRIELVELQSVLQGAGTMPEAWTAYLKGYKSAAVEWSLSPATRGQALPREWSARLAHMEALDSFDAADRDGAAALGNWLGDPGHERNTRLGASDAGGSKLTWYQHVWLGWPIALGGVGGAIGGACGFAAWALNHKVFRKTSDPLLRYLWTGLISVAAVATYLVLAVLFVTFVKKPT